VQLPPEQMQKPLQMFGTKLSKVKEIFQIDFPFNARAGHCSGWHFFGHKSPAARARELFKPSTNSAGLLVSI